MQNLGVVPARYAILMLPFLYKNESANLVEVYPSSKFSNVYCTSLLVVATISVPSEVSVSEGNGTVEVCATLSGVSASDLPISIMLVTTPGIRNIIYI